MRLSVALSLVASAACASAAIMLPVPPPAVAPRAAPPMVAERQQCDDDAGPARAKLLVGAPGHIFVAEFDGTNFEFTANNTLLGTGPSWMVWKEPNHIYAVDENTNNTRHFTYNADGNTIELKQDALGSSGVVHLAFNQAGTRLLGSSYGQGQIDVWDISNSSLRLLKQIVSDDPLGPHESQIQARPHQAVLDPSGRFFAVNDLGTDTILIIDSKDDAFTVAQHMRVPNAGCGPRHGVFVPSDNDPAKASLYVVVCEITNKVEVLEVHYPADAMVLYTAQTLSTLGNGIVPSNTTANARAGAIDVSKDGKDIYVSNRLTGGRTDSIAHFQVIPGSVPGTAGRLHFVSVVSSAGLIPRMFSLGLDDTVLFSTNQKGGLGLVAFARRTAGAEYESSVPYTSRRVRRQQAAPSSGSLDPEPLGSVDVSFFGDEGFGPQFVKQIA